MKKSFKRFALVPAVALLVFGNGCNMVDTPQQANTSGGFVLLTETFCVQFDENRTTGTFASEVVCDQFAQDILDWFTSKGVALNCVEAIFTIGTKIKCVSFSGSHAWDVTSSVQIKRTDIADGPKTLLTSQTLTIPDECDAPDDYRPRLGLGGVLLVNRALDDLTDGTTPTLVATMTATDVDPEPSVTDPLTFSWQACISVAAIVKTSNCGVDDDDDNH